MHNPTHSDKKPYPTLTTEHGLTVTDDSEVFGAAICPDCGQTNPLTGDPATFAGQPLRCMGCTHVMILDETALDQLATEGRDDG